MSNFYEQSKIVTIDDLTGNYIGEGKHKVIINSFEEKITNNGGKMLVMSFKDEIGSSGSMNFNIENSNPTAVEISVKQFKQVLSMIDNVRFELFYKSSNTIDLVGATIYVIGYNRPYNGKNYVNFSVDLSKASEIFINKKNNNTDFNDAPLDKYDPFDEDVPF